VLRTVGVENSYFLRRNPRSMGGREGDDGGGEKKDLLRKKGEGERVIGGFSDSVWGTWGKKG